MAAEDPRRQARRAQLQRPTTDRRADQRMRKRQRALAIAMGVIGFLLLLVVLQARDLNRQLGEVEQARTQWRRAMDLESAGQAADEPALRARYAAAAAAYNADAAGTLGGIGARLFGLPRSVPHADAAPP